MYQERSNTCKFFELTKISSPKIKAVYAYNLNDFDLKETARMESTLKMRGCFFLKQNALMYLSVTLYTRTVRWDIESSFFT